jgi:hypothetical protein
MNKRVAVAHVNDQNICFVCSVEPSPKSFYGLNERSAILIAFQRRKHQIIIREPYGPLSINSDGYLIDFTTVFVVRVEVSGIVEAYVKSIGRKIEEEFHSSQLFFFIIFAFFLFSVLSTASKLSLMLFDCRFFSSLFSYKNSFFTYMLPEHFYEYCT